MSKNRNQVEYMILNFRDVCIGDIKFGVVNLEMIFKVTRYLGSLGGKHRAKSISWKASLLNVIKTFTC